MEPLISVIVPVYNAAAYLPRCIDSILTQTYRHIELVLVNDGSTDDSGAICDRYAAEDARVRVVHQDNAGVGHTRNVGLEQVSGDYITFVDADDYLFPHALIHLLDRITTDDSDLVIGNFVRTYEDGACDAPFCHFPDPVVSRQELLAMMVDFRTVPVCPWGKLYRKRALNGVAYPTVRVGEDMLTFPAVLERCDRISMDNEPIYYYFQHSASLMKSETQAIKQDHLHAALHMARYLWNHGCHSAAANWCSTAVKNALTIRDRQVRLAAFHRHFDRSARRHLWCAMDRKGRIAWLCLHVPLSDHLFRRMFSK